MGIFKRFVNFLPFLSRGGHDDAPNYRPHDDDAPNNRPHEDDAPNNRPQKEEEAPFHGHGPTINAPSVQISPPCDHLGPVLSPRNHGQGGVQGLNWYAKRLKMDEDGDMADEFLDEVVPVTSGPGDRRLVPKFRVQQSTRPVKVRRQMVTAGDIRQGVELNGKWQWV